MKKKTIYMDVCCFNRPFDNQTQDRIYMEAEAVLAVLSHCQNGRWLLASSGIIEYELSMMNNKSKLAKIKALYSIAENELLVTPQVKAFSVQIMKHGIKLMDSLHLALCEVYNQDVLLTTDDQFVRASEKLKIKTRILNPVTFIMEEAQNEK